MVGIKVLRLEYVLDLWYRKMGNIVDIELGRRKVIRIILKRKGESRLCGFIDYCKDFNFYFGWYGKIVEVLSRGEI